MKGDVHDIGKNIVGRGAGLQQLRGRRPRRHGPGERILERAAARAGADLIGLSGLITPSLDEMVHVAREMERQGFDCPLLIGGATTSRGHTAVKIAPAYAGPVVHVADASRAVGVVEQLCSADAGGAFVEENRREQERLRREPRGADARRGRS